MFTEFICADKECYEQPKFTCVYEILQGHMYKMVRDVSPVFYWFHHLQVLIPLTLGHLILMGVGDS